MHALKNEERTSQFYDHKGLDRAEIEPTGAGTVLKKNAFVMDRRPRNAVHMTL